MDETRGGAEGDDDEDFEPPWPGIRKVFSGWAGGIAVSVLVVFGFGAFYFAWQQEKYNEPEHTQVLCVPVTALAGSSAVPAAGSAQFCVTEHR